MKVQKIYFLTLMSVLICGHSQIFGMEDKSPGSPSQEQQGWGHWAYTKIYQAFASHEGSFNFILDQAIQEKRTLTESEYKQLMINLNNLVEKTAADIHDGGKSLLDMLNKYRQYMQIIQDKTSYAMGVDYFNRLKTIIQKHLKTIADHYNQQSVAAHGMTIPPFNEVIIEPESAVKKVKRQAFPSTDEINIEYISTLNEPELYALFEFDADVSDEELYKKAEKINLFHESLKSGIESIKTQVQEPIYKEAIKKLNDFNDLLNKRIKEYKP